MSTTEVSARNTVASVLEAIQTAEKRTVPANGYSRLYLALVVTRETLSFVSFPTRSGRVRLVAALDFLREAEANACAVDSCYPVEEYPNRQRQLDPDSIVGRGFALATHVAQAALADAAMNTIFVLREARLILATANEMEASA